MSNSQPQSTEDNDPPASRPRKRKQSSGTSSTEPRTSRKKSRGPSVPAFDPNADPGEELDPTAVTMASLCDDTGQGRISSKAAQILDNHTAWKKSNREKRARMKAIMEAKKYGRNEDGDAVEQSQTASDQANADTGATAGPSDPGGSAAAANTSEAGDGAEDVTGSGFDYSQSMATSQYSVQVRIGPNGETIIDEESLFVDRTGEDDSANYTHVEESDVTKFVNSGTYGKRYRGCRWTAEETELFYDALSQFGENYELISFVLPGRDRKSCKNKFKAEDKKNPNRITYCLNNRVPYDIQTLSRMTGKDFSGPTPEIRAPVVLTLAEPQEPSEHSTGEQASTANRKQSKTPAPAEEDDEEVLGDISSYEYRD
ncbi:hypothetical protein BV22DRAFT_1000699 [Leucogyrophana mollusca]|uniref:Uncharacterized protein n=1 Tax=Leucogyrophana mollusca TaxID=85980 RepID=A0ACB8BY30_9AGAM|nr:hypothetical protein BV22DRAFT_1000699 [Leucogyrophana mollusca]